MKKVMVVIAMLGCLSNFSFAGGYHHGDEQGPQGEQGPVGETGPQGAPGLNGLNGLNGRDGRDGIDAETHTKVIGGVDVRVLDYQHLALHLFNDYNLRDGRNDSLGARVALKLGSSYEERELVKLAAKNIATTAILESELVKRDERLSALQKEIDVLKFYAHQPGTRQNKLYPDTKGIDGNPYPAERVE